MRWWSGHQRQPSPLWRRLPFAVGQRATLVNVKLKWVKDRALDSVVARERHLRPALHLLDLIFSDPRGHIPAHELSRMRRQIGLLDVRISSFMRRFPALFRESPVPVPCFGLTDDALRLRRHELQISRDTEEDLVERLRRLLMLTVHRSLPLHTINQLRWDMGLQPDYQRSILTRYPNLFELFQPHGDDRVWLRLRSWDQGLAVSELQKNSSSSSGLNGECLAFPVSFTRGFGLKRKCMAWLQEWQTLPYISPYADASGLDPRTDVAEKRMVGVFHEILHLTLGKKTERRNVSNLRKSLGLPQKFTKVFQRHPGIFYLSQKLATQTVVLREAYGGGRELLRKHPLTEIRERYASLMRLGSGKEDSIEELEEGDATSDNCSDGNHLFSAYSSSENATTDEE